MNEPEYFYDLVQGSQPWLEARLGIITASQMSRLITPTGKIANNDDSRTIVYDKLSEIITGRVDEGFSNAHTERGHMFEPFARDLYNDKISHVKECGFITRKFDEGVIGFSPDGLVGDDGLIEIKSPARTKHIKEICMNVEPKAYMMQIQTGLLVTGRSWCDYVAYHNGLPMRVVRILPDTEIHALILEAVKNLYVCINANGSEYELLTEDMQKTQFIEAEIYE